MTEPQIVKLEIEVDLSKLKSFAALELYALDESLMWRSVLKFLFPRPQRVSNGKHLRLNYESATVVAVGDTITEAETLVPHLHRGSREVINCYRVVGAIFFVIACQMPLLFAWMSNQPWAEVLGGDSHTTAGILVLACFLNIALFLAGGIAAFVRASEMKR